MTIKRLKQADWAYDVSDVQNSAGSPLFKAVELNWTRPTTWSKDMREPDFSVEGPFLYALVRNHGNSKAKDHIVYIGLTKSPSTRFKNHPTAKSIVSRKGSVGFCYAPIDFIKGRDRIKRISKALEEIEHLLIWAVGDELENQKKVFSLPGMGSNGGNAWQIFNKGYRFSGRMPIEIVYPWMLIRPGRDRTLK